MGPRVHIGVSLAMGLMLAAGSARATTYYVGGNDQGANWYSGTWSNLQVAFSSARTGDEVRVSGDISRPAGETVVGDLKLTNSGTAGSRIVVSGGWDPDFLISPSASARSVLNGNNDGTANNQNRTLTLSGSNVIVRNLTLTGGDDVYARQAAANYVSGNYCVFSRITVTNNNLDTTGEGRTRGGLRWDGNYGVIEYCQISGNRGGTCGGLDVESGRYVVFANCEVLRNWSSGYGVGGMWIQRNTSTNIAPIVFFNTLVAGNYSTGDHVDYGLIGDGSIAGIVFSGGADKSDGALGAAFVNCTIVDNSRSIEAGLLEGYSKEYFLNSIVANNNGRYGINNCIYVSANPDDHDQAPDNYLWKDGTYPDMGRGYAGWKYSLNYNDMSRGFGHNRNQNRWTGLNHDTNVLTNIQGMGTNASAATNPKFVNAPQFRDQAAADGTTTNIYVADNTRYAVNDVVEINRDGVARKVTGTGSDGGGQYFTIDTALGGSSAKYTGAASTTFIENWGPGKTAGDLAARNYALTKSSPCMDTGAAVDAGTFTYVDVNQNGNYDWGLDIIVRLSGYSPVSMNTPNPTGYDLVYTTDLAGNRRVKVTGIDMGAYEFQPPRGTVVLMK